MTTFPEGIKSSSIKNQQNQTQEGKSEDAANNSNSEDVFLATLVAPEEFFRGPVVNYTTMPAWYTFIGKAASEVEAKMKDAKNKGVAATLKTDVSGTEALSTSISQKSFDVLKEENQSKAQKPFSFEQTVLKPASEGKIVAPSTEANPRDEIAKTFNRFMHYESRYAQRNGSMELVFNPYIVPCFPLAYVDDP